MEVSVVGDGEGGLRFQERVLDALGLEGLVHDVCAGGERSVDVAAGVRRARQHVRLGAPHRDVVGARNGCCRIGDGRKWRVLDVHQRGGSTSGGTVGGDDDGEHVAEVTRVAALGDHHRPVGVDDADAQFAGDVGRGEHGLHAGCRERSGGVDAHDLGPGVFGQHECGVQHAVDTNVIDEPAVAEREFGCFVLRAAGAHAARQRRCRDVGARRDEFDRVEDFHVPGAAAEV